MAEEDSEAQRLRILQDEYPRPGHECPASEFDQKWQQLLERQERKRRKPNDRQAREQAEARRLSQRPNCTIGLRGRQETPEQQGKRHAQLRRDLNDKHQGQQRRHQESRQNERARNEQQAKEDAERYYAEE